MARLFGFLSLVITLALGMYIYSKQVQSAAVPAEASRPKAAIDLTGVKSDLISIATAERRYFSSEGKYASLDELISSHSLTVLHERPPYTYSVETSGGGFRVIATRTTDDGSGAPAQISVDQNMEFQQSQ